MLTLDIAIITHRLDGIRRVAAMQLPRIEGVRYVVSWQSHENADVPDELRREDIEVCRFDGVGLSANRNNSIECCRGDVIIIADDDLRFFEDGIRELRDAYEQNLEVDVITFRSVHESGVCYPTESVRLNKRLPKNYFVTSFELSMRRATAGWLRCCPELGLGSARMHGGEDEMLLLSAIRRGLNCRFFPITVCEHDHPSTGTKAHFTDENLRASGCVIALTYPWTAFLRVPLKAWRVSRAGQASLPRALWSIAQGALEAPGLLHRNRKYLW